MEPLKTEVRLKEIGRHKFDNSQVHKLRVQKQGKKYVVVVDKSSSNGEFMFTVSPAPLLRDPDLQDFHIHEKKICVWDPLKLEPRELHCPHCDCASLESNGWDKRTGYCVSETILIVFRRYTCKGGPHTGLEGKPASPQSFSTLHPKVLSQFSPQLQALFPLQFKENTDSERGPGGKVFTKQLVRHIRACISKRLPAHAVTATINKAYREKYYTARLLFAQCQAGKRGVQLGGQSSKQKTLRQMLGTPPDQPALAFGDYEDDFGWAGKSLTAETLRENLQCYLEGEHALQEQYLQTISGPVLALDFAPALAVVRQDGQRAFKTVAVLKNPIGQISGAYCLSQQEGYTELQPAMRDLYRRNLRLTGKGPVLLYLDNKVAGSKLCRAAIPSLGEGLAPLENGSADDGVRQDIFHLLDRVFSTVPNHAGMQDLKKRACSDLARRTFVPDEADMGNFLAKWRQDNRGQSVPEKPEGWWRQRVLHRVPSRLVLAASWLGWLEMYWAKFDATGIPLISEATLAAFLNQLELILANGVSDPVGFELHTRDGKGFIVYSRGTSTVESSNFTLELAIPEQCGPAWYKLLMLVEITSANLDAAVKRAGQPDYETDHLSLLFSVREVELKLGLDDPFPFLVNVAAEQPGAERFLTDYVPNAVVVAHELVGAPDVGGAVPAAVVADEGALRGRVAKFKDALDKIARGPSAEERHLLLGWNSGGRAVVQSERAMAALGVSSRADQLRISAARFLAGTAAPPYWLSTLHASLRRKLLGLPAAEGSPGQSSGSEDMPPDGGMSPGNSAQHSASEDSMAQISQRSPSPDVGRQPNTRLFPAPRVQTRVMPAYVGAYSAGAIRASLAARAAGLNGLDALRAASPAGPVEEGALEASRRLEAGAAGESIGLMPGRPAVEAALPAAGSRAAAGGFAAASRPSVPNTPAGAATASGASGSGSSGAIALDSAAAVGTMATPSHLRAPASMASTGARAASSGPLPHAAMATGTSNGATAGWLLLQAGLAGGVGGLSGRPGGALEAAALAGGAGGLGGGGRPGGALDAAGLTGGLGGGGSGGRPSGAPDASPGLAGGAGGLGGGGRPGGAPDAAVGAMGVPSGPTPRTPAAAGPASTFGGLEAAVGGLGAAAGAIGASSGAQPAMPADAGGGGSFGAGAARNFGGRAGGATGAGRRIAISAVPLHTRSGGQHSVQSSVQPMVAASGGNAFAMLMSQQGSAAPPPGPQLKKGSGYGGAGGSRKCLKCSPVAAGLFPHDESKWVVPLAKHVCWDWLKSQGLDPNLYPHASERQQNKKAGYEKRKRK